MTTAQIERDAKIVAWDRASSGYAIAAAERTKKLRIEAARALVPTYADEQTRAAAKQYAQAEQAAAEREYDEARAIHDREMAQIDARWQQLSAARLARQSAIRQRIYQLQKSVEALPTDTTPVPDLGEDPAVRAATQEANAAFAEAARIGRDRTLTETERRTRFAAACESAWTAAKRCELLAEGAFNRLYAEHTTAIAAAKTAREEAEKEILGLHNELFRLEGVQL